MRKRQKDLKISNSTKRKVDISKWKNWTKKYAKIPPTSVQIIYMRDYKKIVNIADDKEYIKIYRGGLYNKEIYVIVNKHETKDSLSWIFLHELAHWIIEINPILSTYIDKKEKNLIKNMVKRKLSTEDREELSYEECFADVFATVILGKDFNNAWLNNRSENSEYY